MSRVDPRAEAELAKIKAIIENTTVFSYCIDCYAEFHDIPKQEASEILNGCGAMDGFYEQDMVIIGHMSMSKLISLLRGNVEACGGTNPPAILPKQMGYETVTELWPSRNPFLPRFSPSASSENPRRMPRAGRTSWMSPNSAVGTADVKYPGDHQ